jgi:hypothetical protein
MILPDRLTLSARWTIAGEGAIALCKQITVTVFVASLAQSSGGNGSLMAHEVRVQTLGLCRVRSGSVFVRSRETGAWVRVIDKAKRGVGAANMG